MRRRILVVDDDAAMAQTLCDILELRGWQTFMAHDGLEAAELAQVNNVDMVLMDLKMPRMNGVEAFQLMKAARPSTRVVLMTAYATQDLVAQAEREGVMRVMRKPVAVSELLDLLDTVVTRARSVLVVDDDPLYLRTMCEILGRNGIRTTQARTLPEALFRLQQEPPGAILLDLKLGNVDVTNHLLAFKAISPTVLVILHSGYVTELADAVEGAGPGLVNAAFTKPAPIDELLQIIDGDIKR